ncbi:HD domain-containing phosphohydrolase [Vibrio alfacsensis]|uniref:HD domain-containing phosphohydrolase n=1 Tax=Vibrio alfacsensis TaxID=1074311 RepID=UPI004067AED9
MNYSPQATIGFEVNLKQALTWIARALNYVGIDDTNYSHRVAYIAYQCALTLGWASNHHERLDGSGYPYHKTEPDVPSRITAVADLFQALSQDISIYYTLSTGS